MEQLRSCSTDAGSRAKVELMEDLDALIQLFLFRLAIRRILYIHNPTFFHENALPNKLICTRIAGVPSGVPFLIYLLHHS